MNLDKLIEHDDTEDCPACRAQDLVVMALLPAVQAWEQRSELPQFSLALHGAAGLLGAMIENGVPRNSIEEAMSALLDEIEEEIAHDKMLGGPPQGTA
ncbi:MAG: hypothetical protein K5872_06815 [Rhizobiaceae bacterium]|nr:hypothetical protein [Rhizobiaceae bacterium]MCV0405924.1 hypothetical protein [Rhizobiaceae bacterium]